MTRVEMLVLLLQSESGGAVASIVLLVFGTIGLALYVLPTIIAVMRGHPNIAPIAIVNILLGWSFIAWVVSLAWAFSNSSDTRK